MESKLRATENIGEGTEEISEALDVSIVTVHILISRKQLNLIQKLSSVQQSFNHRRNMSQVEDAVLLIKGVLS